MQIQKTRQDKIYEVIAFVLVVGGFVAYAIYNHYHTRNNYVTTPVTNSNQPDCQMQWDAGSYVCE